MRSNIDIDALRARLAGLQGRALWRGLDEAADTPAFRRMVAEEFPALAARGPFTGSRRRFLSLMGATMALAGLGGCGRNTTETDQRSGEVPFVRQPTDLIPGARQTYSSAMLQDGIAHGTWISTIDGRPTKLEGNPDHPLTRGGSDIFLQATVLGLYDPDRSQSVRLLGRITDWPTFETAMTGHMAAQRAEQGAGLRVLSPPVSSPTLQRQIAAMRTAFPQMQWHGWAASGRERLYAATQRVFGQRLETWQRFDRAQVVVALDGDFLDPGPQQIALSRDWADARRKAASSGKLLTLYAAGPTPSLTMAKADFPVAVDAADMMRLVAALEAAATGGAVPDDAPGADWVRRAGAALHRAAGAGIVTAGAFQPDAVLDAVHRLNARLGHVGRSIAFTPAPVADLPGLAPLVADMQAGKVAALVMLDCNPVHASPAFAAALGKVQLKVHAGLYLDETADVSDWHLPLAHVLESWGDARALDGTVTLIQPGINPLYGGRSVHEIVSLLADPQPQSGLALLRATHKADDAQWRNWLLAGFVAGSAPAEVPVTAQGHAPAPAAQPGGLHVLIRPDANIWDGAMGNLGWLQELPRPLTKVTWQNVVAVSPALAAREKLQNGDMVHIAAGGHALEGPAWILPGQAEDCVTLTLGYGRTTGGNVIAGLGYNAYPLLPDGGWEIAGATLRRADGSAELATTQEAHAINGEGLVRVQAMGAAPVGNSDAKQADFYPGTPTDGRSWGMVIDLDACIGCNACVVACQAENNIPVVGADQVRQGRDMHWLRVDRYYEGGLDAPRTHFMPVPCMQCENAPCEVGCPVEATLHDHEGLNLQVYNRCIGTRACSGYCPYKVRRFNFLDYTADTPPSQQAQFNPDVTVRSRGVMEKCTYCVQRIAEARLRADRDNRPIDDGEVKTACQQGCPTRAISFGDLMDQRSAVLAARRDGRNYALLGELNTRPHTTYLAEWAPPGEAKS